MVLCYWFTKNCVQWSGDWDLQHKGLVFLLRRHLWESSNLLSPVQAAGIAPKNWHCSAASLGDPYTCDVTLLRVAHGVLPRTKKRLVCANYGASAESLLHPQGQRRRVQPTYVTRCWTHILLMEEGGGGGSKKSS